MFTYSFNRSLNICFHIKRITVNKLKFFVSENARHEITLSHNRKKKNLAENELTRGW